MMSKAIQIEHLSKYYNLGVINNGSLYRDIQTWFALKRGKDDPHSMLTAKDYEATPDGFWALKNISLDINQGDRVGIIGKNGAGKSTLLKILSRITAPTEGNIKIKGRIASLLEVGTGFHGELTGRENIYLNGAILGMSRKEIDSKLDEIIAFSEIEHHIDTPVKRYSSGMYVRLAFAVAAHLNSEILIADEVLAVGDASFQKKAIGKMNELSVSEGRTILFVSHQMEAVQRLCTSGIILEKGRLVYHNNEIEKVVSQYLRPESMAETNNEWKSDGSIKDNNFKPERIYFLKGKKKTTEFLHTDNKITCNIEAEIKDVHSMLNFCVAVKRADNSTVFITWLKEMDDELDIQPGFNRFSVTLPINLLKSGDYYLDLHVGIFNEKEIVPFQTVMLPFKILGESSSRQGDIYTSLHWKVTHDSKS
ncbi:MAG: ATP-binding cassette domain-containing protein [Spirochaetaceae bacterium]|nr:ATP-binding cassette domain-containing protein [Spirochaetaceae bacterium]